MTLAFPHYEFKRGGRELKADIPTALEKLRDAKPENCASQYDPMQVSAHKDAVSLFEPMPREAMIRS
jgi:hypothetical protein